MTYVITFNEETEKFAMNGYEETFIGDLFLDIAIQEGLRYSLVTQAASESQALSILLSHGVKIELVDIDW